MVRLDTMLKKRYKNDYKIYSDLQYFANKTTIGRFLKPVFKDAYAACKVWLPYPRDFLLHLIPRGGVCGEIGVYDGVFSERILRIVRPKTLYLVDPWVSEYNTGSKIDSQKLHDQRYHNVQHKFKHLIESGVVKIMRSTSNEAVSRFPNKHFDFLYIDGDHSYEQVAQDLHNFFPKMKPGGFLCGDDYHYKSVKRAVDEFVHEQKLSLETKDEQFMIIIPTSKTL